MLTLRNRSCKSLKLFQSALLASCVSLAACSTVDTQSFVAPQNSVVESAQIASDADFSMYDRLHAVDMGVFYPPGAATSAEDLQRIRSIFRTAFLSELDGYDIATDPGPGAMTVQATLIDFRNAAYADTMSVGAQYRDMAAPGKIVFLMEMRDSMSDKLLARAADSAKTPAIADEQGETTNWSSVEDAARHWAALFRNFLDNNLRR